MICCATALFTKTYSNKQDLLLRWMSTPLLSLLGHMTAQTQPVICHVSARSPINICWAAGANEIKALQWLLQHPFWRCSGCCPLSAYWAAARATAKILFTKNTTKNVTSHAHKHIELINAFMCCFCVQMLFTVIKYMPGAKICDCPKHFASLLISDVSGHMH